MNCCQNSRISAINPGWRGWLSAAEDVDEDTIVAMARSAVARRFPYAESPQIVAGAVLAGLIKKLFLLSGLAGRSLLGLPNC
jgi:hypothetical protein